MILFKNDGTIVRQRFYDGKEHETVISNSLIPYLTEELHFETGVTFGMFMSHIFKFVNEYNIVFASHLGHYNLSDWKEDFEKEYKMKPDDDSLLYVELSHAFIELPARGVTTCLCDAEVYDTFNGVGLSDGELTSIAIEFTSLSEYKQLLFRLNPTFVFYIYPKMDEPFYTTTRTFSVYDVIGGVLYEISFAGSPKTRDAHWKDIVDDVNEFNKNGKVIE